MDKKIILERIISENTPIKILFISNTSTEVVRLICNLINQNKLSNFQYFHNKISLLIFEDFEKKEVIESYKNIREEFDKVLDIFLFNLSSDISLNILSENFFESFDCVINDFENFDKNFLSHVKYQNFFDITNFEGFKTDRQKFNDVVLEPKSVEYNQTEKIYKTDKFEHGYIQFYENYFSQLQNVKNVLEIGISEGSMNYLRDRFPSSKIYGIDIENKSDLNSDRIITFVANQENRDDLHNFLNSCDVNFDIIIDDGGHTMKQQQTTLGVLFNRLSDGGMYIIENMHTLRLENLGTISNDDIITTLDMLFNFNYTKKIISNHITDEEKNYINSNINMVDIWSENSQYNLSVTSVIKKKGLVNSEIFGDKVEVIKNSFDIGITTFSLRFNFIENLLNKIKDLGIKNRIFLCINGEKDGNFDSDYRKKILNICSSVDNVYPIFFVETRGLSKLWNTLIVHSVSENILIMNDDINLETDDIFNSVLNHINTKEYYGLTKINNTFSYFVCNKKFMDSLGYFDERLLGFGEEDGDITHRIIQIYNKEISNISANGVKNIVSDIRHEYIQPGIGKYSLFNRQFMFNQKYENRDDGIKGMFDYPCLRILDNVNLYPYENFFMENKSKL